MEGDADPGIEAVGRRWVTNPLGSALDWTAPGRLAMVRTTREFHL